jgi:exopolysaccharide production protein ExoQ
LLVAGNWFWSNLRHVKGLRTIIGGLTVAGILAVLLIALSLFNASSLEEVFELVGRDSTFTGRTALWEQAQRTSAEHPILGVGAGGFWQYDIGAAQSLAINDNKAPGTVLGFHISKPRFILVTLDCCPF